MKIDVEWLQKVIKIIEEGLVEKMVKDNITVYRVKNIIRIDIKEV